MTGKLLNPEQRQSLVHQTTNPAETLRRRARLLLLYDEGYPTIEAAHGAGFSRSQARHWKHQFQIHGLDVFPKEQDEEVISPTEKFDNIISQAAGIETIESQKTAGDVQNGEEKRFGLPFPRQLKKPGIEAGDSLAEAGQKTWLYLFAEMLAHEEGTRLGENPEELHDMRVATRRMRTAFDVFGAAFKSRALKPHQKGLRKIGRALGRVRDMDVLIEKAVRYQESLPAEMRLGLSPLLQGWKQVLDTDRAALLTHFNSPEYTELKYNFNIFLQTPGAGFKPLVQDPPKAFRVRDVVPVIIYTRLAAVRGYDAVLSNASLSQLHALRIEYKKLRYCIEYFREVLGDGTGEVINVLKRMQDHLGDLHDADVTCQLLNNFLKTWETNQVTLPLTERQNSEPMVAYLAHQHAERHRLIVSFPEAWDYFTHSEFRHHLAQAVSVL